MEVYKRDLSFSFFNKNLLFKLNKLLFTYNFELESSSLNENKLEKREMTEVRCKFIKQYFSPKKF